MKNKTLVTFAAILSLFFPQQISDCKSILRSDLGQSAPYLKKYAPLSDLEKEILLTREKRIDQRKDEQNLLHQEWVDHYLADGWEMGFEYIQKIQEQGLFCFDASEILPPFQEKIATFAEEDLAHAIWALQGFRDTIDSYRKDHPSFYDPLHEENGFWELMLKKLTPSLQNYIFIEDFYFKNGKLPYWYTQKEARFLIENLQKTPEEERRLVIDELCGLFEPNLRAIISTNPSFIPTHGEYTSLCLEILEKMPEDFIDGVRYELSRGALYALASSVTTARKLKYPQEVWSRYFTFQISTKGAAHSFGTDLANIFYNTKKTGDDLEEKSYDYALTLVKKLTPQGVNEAFMEEVHHQFFLQYGQLHNKE